MVSIQQLAPYLEHQVRVRRVTPYPELDQTGIVTGWQDGIIYVRTVPKYEDQVSKNTSWTDEECELLLRPLPELVKPEHEALLEQVLQALDLRLVHDNSRPHPTLKYSSAAMAWRSDQVLTLKFSEQSRFLSLMWADKRFEASWWADHFTAPLLAQVPAANRVLAAHHFQLLP